MKREEKGKNKSAVQGNEKERKKKIRKKRK